MLVKKPPMGWNSWNTFTGNINEALIMETADAMVSEGLLDAGYEYLVIDDVWSCRKRDENGMLKANPEKFPHGMKYIADYVHSKGLKFGMYSCNGVMTCERYPGSYGHEFEDARFFAEIGIDYLKYDNCYKPTTPSGALLYQKMAMALKATGRDILFSACNWGTEDVHSWARSVGAHMFRSTPDITDTFESILSLSNSQMDKYCYSAPGCFNDMDMLISGMRGTGNIGKGHGCTNNEYRYHFAMWCMMGSPLMMGCDVRNLTPENKSLLLNKHLLRIDQDEEVRPPFILGKMTTAPNMITMFKHLSNGEYAMGFFNPMDDDMEMYVALADIGLSAGCGYGLTLTDVFTDETTGPHSEFIKEKVSAHDCRVFLAHLQDMRTL